MVSLRFKIGASALWLLLATSVAIGKEWRGIVPLKSTRADVERVFGVAKNPSDWISLYKLANEIVVFNFETQGCDTDLGAFGYAWNVPLGTVTSIGIIPRGAHRLEEYKAANNFKIDDNGTGFVYYTDASAGFMIENYKNLVTLVEYYPESAQAKLQCPRTRECCYHLYSRFDEYSDIPFADEKARLDNFMFQLNAGFWRGTLEIQGPSKEDRQRRMKLAARGKRYLVKERGLEPERLLIVDGGFNEIGFTRHAMYSMGGVGTRLYLYPRKDPATAPPATRLKPSPKPRP
jgi:hypothetical protein